MEAGNKLTTKEIEIFMSKLDENFNLIEYNKINKDKIIEKIIEYINNKIKRKVILYNPEKEVFSIIDEKEKVLETLKNLGLVKNI